MSTALIRDTDILTSLIWWRLQWRQSALRNDTDGFFDAAFAKGLSVESVGTFDENDAGTVIIRTRYYIYAPSKFAHIVFGQRLIPREAWMRLGGAIYATKQPMLAIL